MSKWVKVARVDDFDETVGVECNGHPVALFKLEDGVYALDDICSHEYSRLSEGEVWDEDVYCAKHGSRFEIRSGTVHGLPATKPVNTHEVKVEDGEIYVRCKE